MEKLTHFKKINNPNYLGSYSLATGEDKDGKPTYTDLVVEIVEVVNENVIDLGTHKEEKCVVAHLKNSKPMILNMTNQKTIADIVGSPYIERWRGQKITLYVAKVKAFGDIHDALRIRPQAPKQVSKPELKPTDANLWAKCVKALKGTYTIEQIEAKYLISAENRELLLTEAI